LAASALKGKFSWGTLVFVSLICLKPGGGKSKLMGQKEVADGLKKDQGKN